MSYKHPLTFDPLTNARAALEVEAKRQEVLEAVTPPSLGPAWDAGLELADPRPGPALSTVEARYAASLEGARARRLGHRPRPFLWALAGGGIFAAAILAGLELAPH